MATWRQSILAVDDMPEVLISINEILGDTYEVHLAKSARSAGKILDRTKVDLILLDMEMPELSGLEFLEALREKPEWRRIPVVMVSANSQLRNVSKAIKLGAKDYVVKPLNAILIRDKIYKILLAERFGPEPQVESRFRSNEQGKTQEPGTDRNNGSGNAEGSNANGTESGDGDGSAEFAESGDGAESDATGAAGDGTATDGAATA
jgi:PleD family two-component response regulator